MIKKALLTLILTTACASSMRGGRLDPHVTYRAPGYPTDPSEEQGVGREISTLFHSAVDDNRILVVELETNRDFCSVNLSFNFLTNRRGQYRHLPQLGESCELICNRRTTCAIVIPRGYTSIRTYVGATHTSETPTIADLRFRTRLAGQNVVEQSLVPSGNQFELRELSLNE